MPCSPVSVHLELCSFFGIRVAEQRNRLTTPGQALGHGARTDDRRDQNGATKAFVNQAAGKEGREVRS